MPKLTKPQREYDWQAIRDAYLQRSPCPTYKGLAEEFEVPISSLGAVGREENWPQMRLDRQNRALQQIKAGEIIAEAITADKVCTDRAKQAALKLYDVIDSVAEALKEQANDIDKARKVADMINTLSFALYNTSNALKTLGVVGMPKQLGEAGAKLPNGHWDKGLLQQINVTIGGLTGQAQVTAQDTTQSRSVPTATEQTAKEGGQQATLPAEQPAIEVSAKPVESGSQPESQPESQG